LRKGDDTSFLWMNAMNKNTLHHYYDILHGTLKEHNLFNSTLQICNIDESGITLDLIGSQGTHCCSYTRKKCIVRVSATYKYVAI